jgi:hypothetical protein
VSDLAAAEGADVILSRDGSLLQLDSNAKLLAPMIVRHAKALHIRDCGMTA